MSQDTNGENATNQYRTSHDQNAEARVDRVWNALTPYIDGRWGAGTTLRWRIVESALFRVIQAATLDGKIDVPTWPPALPTDSQAQMASAWTAVFSAISEVNGGSFPVRHDARGNELTARDAAVEYIRELAQKAEKLDGQKPAYDLLMQRHDRVVIERDHLSSVNDRLAKRIAGSLDTTIRNAIANTEPDEWKYLQCVVRAHPDDPETLQIDEIMVRKDGFLPNFGQNVPASSSPSENTATPSTIDAAIIELSSVDLAFNEAIDTISENGEPDVLSLCTAQEAANRVRTMLHTLKSATPERGVRVINVISNDFAIGEDAARRVRETLVEAMKRNPVNFDTVMSHGVDPNYDENTAVIPPNGLWTWNFGHGAIAVGYGSDNHGLYLTLHEAEEPGEINEVVERKPNSPGVMLRFADAHAVLELAGNMMRKLVLR